MKIEGDEPPPIVDKPQSSQLGCIVMVSAVPVAIFPLFVAAGSGSSNMWSEGPGGGGAVIWAMLATVPLGILTFIVGAIMQVVSNSRAKKNSRKG